MIKQDYHFFQKKGIKYKFFTRSLVAEKVDNGRDTPEPEPQEPVIFIPKPVILTTLILTLTEECNLCCQYCFERLVNPGQKVREMSFEIAKKSISLFLSLPHSSQSTIVLFGGEPLLWWKHLPALLKYGNEQAVRCKTQFQWHISTNGTLLTNEIIDFLLSNRIVLMIDIDGNKRIHDSLRPFRNGYGSYDIILANYLAIREREQSIITLRATITPEHPFLFQTYQFLSSLNPDEIALFPQYFTTGSGWSYQALGVLLFEYSNLADELLSSIISGSYQKSPPFPFSIFLYHLCAREKIQDYCGAYSHMIAVAPDGLLYPCSALDGQKKYCIGNLSTGLDKETYRLWTDICKTEDRQGCKECWARSLCGGGCIAHTIIMKGECSLPAGFECIIIQHLIELSIWVYLEVLEKRPDYFIFLLSDTFMKRGLSSP